MIYLNMLVGVAGLTAALWIIAVTIHQMHRRRHALSLWGLAAGLGMTSVATIFAPPGADLDTGMMLAGEALLVVGTWSIILTRSQDERR